MTHTNTNTNNSYAFTYGEPAYLRGAAIEHDTNTKKHFEKPSNAWPVSGNHNHRIHGTATEGSGYASGK